MWVFLLRPVETNNCGVGKGNIGVEVNTHCSNTNGRKGEEGEEGKGGEGEEVGSWF